MFESLYLNLFVAVSGLYLLLNLLGLLYSKAILDTYDKFIVSPIRSHIHKHDASSFRKHLPLILLNIGLMIIIFPTGLYFLSDWLLEPYQHFGIVIGQLIAILLIDDLYFYFYHRLLHKNFLYKNIHYIHHRAKYPFPSDYLYEHPFEWMLGAIGSFIAFLILGGVSLTTILLFLTIRTLHELDIHSGIKSSFYKHMPFAGTNEHHAFHHRYFLVHFASIFSVWDKIFKTDIDAWPARFKKLGK